MNTLILTVAVVSLLILLMLSLMLKPVRKFCLLLLHSAAGWVGLYIWNYILPGYFLAINIASASIVGILGVPGLLLMLLIKHVIRL